MRTWHFNTFTIPLLIFLICFCCTEIECSKTFIGRRLPLCVLFAWKLPFRFTSDILHAVLGLPSECVHNNVVRSCTLSFSCWIQGGRHVSGCGDNRWLFSCCVGDGDLVPMMSFARPSYLEKEPLPMRFTLTKLKMKPTAAQQNVLRRRIDDEPVGSSIPPLQP